MSSRVKASPKHNHQPPPYVGWRGELIARLALTRAGLAVQDAPAPQPFDLLASTPDGFYFLVEVCAYSSIHGAPRPAFDQSRDRQRWTVDPSLLRAVTEVNLPVVLFVVDADRELGHFARLDHLPRPNRDRGTTFVLLTADQNLSPNALAALVSGLRQDWAVSRRPA
jgi:hypothetical protein